MVSRKALSFKVVDVRKPKSPASVRARKVLKKREGKNVGLKKPAQKFPDTGQVPGVSMKATIPLIINRESHAKIKYNNL